MNKKRLVSDFKKYFHQLRLLLWKNLIIKKRSLVVFIFELTVPLVLFLIMAAIRIKQHTIPVDIVYFDAWPLPSAGFVPLMQSFCNPENGVRNEYGFLEYPNSTAKEMIEQIEKITKSTWSSSWFKSSGAPLDSTFRSNRPARNIKSLSDDLLQLLIDNTDAKGGSRRAKRSPSGGDGGRVPSRLIFIFDESLPRRQHDKSEPVLDRDDMYELLVDHVGMSTHQYELFRDNTTIDVLQMFQLGSGASDLASLFKNDRARRPELTRKFVCDRERFEAAVSMDKVADERAEVRSLQSSLCHMNEAQMTRFSQLMRDDEIQRLSEADPSTDAADLEKKILDFTHFAQAIDDLSLLSAHFPRGLCGNKKADEIIKEGDSAKNQRPNIIINEITDPSLKGNLTQDWGFIGLWMNMQKTFCGVDPSSKSDAAAASHATTTKQPMTSSGQANQSHAAPDQEPSDLNISKSQLKTLSLLFHVIYSNPVILYAPNTSLVYDNLISKTNATFELVDRINMFCREWLDNSDRVKDYLRHQQTNQSLANLRTFKELAANVTDGSSGRDQPELVKFSLNDTAHLHVNVSSFAKRRDASGDDKLLGLMNLLPNQTAQELVDKIELIDSAACSWLSLMSRVNLNVFKGFASEDDLVKYFLNNAYNDNVTVIASVIFQLGNSTQQDRLDPHITYKIRQNASFTITTKRIRERYWYPSPRDWDYYYYLFGFVWLQDLIDRAIINYHANATVLEPGMHIQQMPYPCYMIDNFLQMIQHVMPLMLILSFVYTVSIFNQTIVIEKELRLKEVMKIMGLNNSVHLFAWFITYFVQFTLVMVIVTAILHYGKILTHSNPFLIFFLLEIYAVTTICFSFLISSLYSKAKLAAACAGIIYFLSYVPCMYISIREDVAYEIIPWWAKAAASLLSTSAFGIGSKYIAFYENDGTGLQWSNIDKTPLENDTFNCLVSLKIMVFDCFIYLLLAWYIENVNPSYGIPLPWNYPFKASYWLGRETKIAADSDDAVSASERRPGANRFFSWFGGRHGRTPRPILRRGLSHSEPEQARILRNHFRRSSGATRGRQGAPSGRRAPTSPAYLFEQEPSNFPVGVSIRNLTKRYGDAKVAVDNLSINFYENQITSFLGHNGAGKTTTMNMLTGLIPATSGHAIIYGKDIRNEINSIRNNMGWCPQHNVLFDKLTVEEHLWFYAKLKHMNDGSISALIENMLADTGLTKKRKNLINTLSGGMQRKLSVAVAFVGEANLVILDEPTAGVDPYARRAIWDLLLKYKTGRTIILSTHHMDEAELLGDRIAIISDGRLQCCGTSLFLKNALGEGNHLTLVKDNKLIEREKQMSEDQLISMEGGSVAATMAAAATAEASSSSHDADAGQKQQPFNNTDRVLRFIRKYIPTVYLKAETIREYHFVIPLSERSNRNFWELFHSLEANLASLNVDSYGIHDVSLEEVFIKAAEIKQVEGSVADVQAAPRVGSRQRPRRVDEAEASDETNDSEDDLLGDDEREEDLAEEASLSDLETSGSSVARSAKSLYNLDHIYAELEVGSRLYFKQFKAIIAKRFLYNKRNWKSLLTQIVLPAWFVCIAMTVALSAPGFFDLPPLELSTAQYYPLTEPEGIYIPFSYMPAAANSTPNASGPATSAEIVDTLKYLVGLGSTCTLNTLNLTIDDLINYSYGASGHDKLLNQKYFGRTDDCPLVFNQDADIDQRYFPLSNASAKRPDPFSKYRTHHLGDGKNYYPSCVCLKDFSGFECAESSFDWPESLRLVTHETLLNISGQNETKYYLYTTDLYRLKRYGGLSFDNHKPLSTPNLTAPAARNDEDASIPYISDSIKNYELIQNIATNRLARVWYNNKAFHAIPTFLNVMNNALLRANVKKNLETTSTTTQKRSNAVDELNLQVKASTYGITVINHPMNQTNNYLSTEYLLQGSDVLISIFTLVAMSFVNASFVLFLVYERSIKSLHLQFLIGLNPLLYWVTNFFWDMINYMLPASCVILILKIFDVPAYVQGDNYPAVIALFILYGWSVSPLMYPASFLFKEPSNAYIFLIVINLFTGITCVESSFLFQVFSFDKDLKFIYDAMKTIFLIFPPYCLGRGLIDIAYNDYYNTFYLKTGQLNKVRSPFEWDIASRNLLSMAIIGVVSWVFTLLLEYDFFKFRWVRLGRRSGQASSKYSSLEPSKSYQNYGREDPDVQYERTRVEDSIQNGATVTDQYVLRGLRKVYEKQEKQTLSSRLGSALKPAVVRTCLCMRRLFGSSKFLNKLSKMLLTKTSAGGQSFVAVKNLTFGVPKGECFGLLGVNGAGKTTTFKMLTGDLRPTEGDILLFKSNSFESMINAKSERSAYWSEIGYCPQFDALYDELTPSDHIRLFARLKGIKAKFEPELCESLLKRLDLLKYADKPVGELSLGNKRKLSTALALVGNPSIVLLDEPTSAMDPVSRRRLWEEIINLTKQKNRSVLLTSHSMEECEVLCTRLAIMVDGKFKCMGSVQHLKTKFGDGYTLTVKLREMPKSLAYESNESENESNEFNVSSASARNQADESTAATDSSERPYKNKYIRLILRELRDKISPKCALKERHFNNVYQFELPYPNQEKSSNGKASNDSASRVGSGSFDLGDVYRLIELNKLKFNIADYSLSQNTLDNVFINFVKEQVKSQSRAQSSDPGELDDESDSSSEDASNSGSNDSIEHNRAAKSDIQFPIHDNDDLLIEIEENFIDLSSSSPVQSSGKSQKQDHHLSANKNVPRFELSLSQNASFLNDDHPPRGSLSFASLDRTSGKTPMHHFEMEMIEDDYC